MIKRALFALTFLATALPAIAAPAAEGGHAEPSLFAGDIGNVFWTVLIFGLVLFILSKFAWGPLLGSLQARESFIRESLEKAKREREEAEARLREYEERLAAARTEASAIVEEGRRDADVVKRQIEESAKVEADKMVERAKREIQLATDTATKELYTLSARLATQMAARVIGRELTPQDHERLISEGIQGIGGAGRN
ncbi:MAG TPA: F0F1 ATP synthase subunit B [Thermoanaerobaculia bacterium]